MAAGFRVAGRVAIRRVVATERGAALLADAQVHPCAPDLHAFFALAAFRVLDHRDGGNMGAGGVRQHERTLLVQDLVDEGHGNRALPDRRRHPLDVASADITDREHPRQAGLEEMWRPRERPCRRRQILM
jgi:hypothetical protein